MRATGLLESHGVVLPFSNPAPFVVGGTPAWVSGDPVMNGQRRNYLYLASPHEAAQVHPGRILCRNDFRSGLQYCLGPSCDFWVVPVEPWHLGSGCTHAPIAISSQYSRSDAQPHPRCRKTAMLSLRWTIAVPAACCPRGACVHCFTRMQLSCSNLLVGDSPHPGPRQRLCSLTA